MSDSPRSISAWWILLLVPVALPIGWLLGRVDGPRPAPRKPAPPTAAAASVIRKWPPTPAAGIGVQVRKAQRAIPAQPPAEEPKKPEPPAIVSQWTDIESAIAESKHNGKPILIDFNAEWCSPCQRLKRQVFDDADRGQAVQTAVIPVSIVDRRREEGTNPADIDQWQERFRVEGFPTLVVFSPETGRAERTVGFGDPDLTVQWIAEAAKSVR